MENVLRAGRDGRVTKLRAKPGDSLASIRSFSSWSEADACGASAHRRPRAGRRLSCLGSANGGASRLRGWVRNRADGSVEALVIGDEPAVAAMVEACRRGPRAATVADVAVREAEDDGSPDFAARPTI